MRGSTSAPGRAFARVGGHTSCIALAHDGESPRLVLDAGSGLREVTTLMGEAPFRGSILLGHLHWDHTEGLPFFRAGDRDDAVVRVMVPEQAGGTALELIGRVMSPPNFPITPTELDGAWSFEAVAEGRREVEGFEVTALEIPHKGGRTFGYRITDGHATVAYLSDHAPHSLGDGDDGMGVVHESAVALATNADLLIHDAQYTPAELTTRRGYGHSAAPYGAALAAQCGARRVLLFHHEPNRTDDQVEAIAADVARRHPDVDVDIAREGMVIDL